MMSAQPDTQPNATLGGTLLGAIGRTWWVVLLYGVVAVLFGLLALTKPIAAAVAMTATLGVFALVDAVTSLIAWFRKDVAGARGWLLLYAIVSLLFGLMALAAPLATAGALTVVLAIWLIIGGVFRVVLGIQVRKEIDGEWLIILSGVLMALLGVLFLADPLAGMVTTTLWVGALTLVFGALQIFAGLKLRKLRAV